MREIYFDNSATTCPSPAVREIVMRAMEEYGNPSSMHRKGVDAEKYVRQATEILAGTMGVSESEIYFTSGGTESNNWAILGTALAAGRRGKKIISTGIEHPAVSEPLAFLKKRGFEIALIPVDGDGQPDLGALKEMLTPDVILVSTMFVNNEIGTVLPVAEIAELVHRLAPEALYHVDAVQAYGRRRIHPRRLGIDLMSMSGHKLHGPKGVGALYMRKDAHVVSLIHGGGQQRNMRSGTENVPGIAGLGVAAAEAHEDMERKNEHVRALRERIRSGISDIEGSFIHASGAAETAPHILSAAFPGVRAEVLLHALEDRGIFVSAGSACSTHKRTGSPVMRAIGAPKEIAESTVRFSFCDGNTEEEVDEALVALRELLPYLSRYRAR